MVLASAPPSYYNVRNPAKGGRLILTTRQETAMLTRYVCCLSVAITLSVCIPLAARAAELDQAALAGDKAPDGAIWLESLDLSKIDQGWSEPHAGRSVDNNPLKIHGQQFRHGVGTHAVSDMHIDLKGAAEKFVSMVGVDDESGRRGTVSFEVLVDGKKVAGSGRMKGGDAAKRLEADLRGAKQLALLVEDADDGITNDHADWAGALIVLAAGATERPQTVGSPDAAPPAIAHDESPLPAIHGPRITGSTPGRPFLFLIPATGEKPLSFAAKNLPEGLSLDAETGIISGSLKQPGETKVDLEVKNARGTATRELTIVGGPHKLALTPPMGWNSWNCWASAVSDAKVRAAADAMVKSGLAAHGFQYINIDDCWEGKRDASGEIQTNQKFPDMKALADYVHSKGLKLGIYSSPGPRTCAGYEASWKHEAQDAKTYARWGIDYLKYDWCSYGQIAPHPDRAALLKPYQVMRRGLDECGRDIVFSLCQYGMGDVWTWGAEVGGNCWRTTGDIGDSWSSMSGIGFSQNGHEKYAGPGHWNDPDMLVVGKVGWGPSLRPTHLKPNEQLTHIALWCLLSSPLLIGCDMSGMDPFTLALLTNDEVLDINQDPLGKPAGRVAGYPPAGGGQTEVWARPLFDGTTAVGLFNRGRQEAKVKVQWSDLNREGPQAVRDLWLHKDVGEQADGYEASVPPHGVVLIKVGKGK
jgi:alpha-galactosidase